MNDIWFNKSIRSARLLLYLLVIILIGVTGYFFYSLINQLPIEDTTLAMDWKGLWRGMHRTWPRYDTGVRNAPWSLWAIWPVAQLPFRPSWATLSLLTLIVLIVSVPKTDQRKSIWLISILLLTTSYFSLRHIADGNLEGLVIAGLLLILSGFKTRSPVLVAAGSLMATAKIQEVWLFMLVAGIYILRVWDRREWLKAAGYAAMIAVPSFLLLGMDWLSSVVGIPERGSIMDSSLLASGARFGLPQLVVYGAWAGILLLTLWVAMRAKPTMSREKAGLLICASLMLAPYMAGNSYLTILAIGVIPLFQANLLLGGLLIGGVDILYFASPQFLFNWSATYIFGLTLLTWLILLIRVHRAKD